MKEHGQDKQQRLVLPSQQASARKSLRNTSALQQGECHREYHHETPNAVGDSINTTMY